MTPISQAVLVYVALGAGVVATFLTLAIQLHGLGKLADRSAHARAIRRGTLAAGVGMGSVCGASFAMAAGGPGAIGWMWIASILGMALAYAEAKLSMRIREEDDGDAPGPLIYIRKAWGPVGKIASGVFGLGLLGFALTAGAGLQGQQSGLLVGELFGVPALGVGVALAILAVPLLMLSQLRDKAIAQLVAPAVVVAYIALLLVVLAGGEASVGEQFARITGSMFSGQGSGAAGAIGGGIAMVMQWGVLRATLAGEAGLGSAGLVHEGSAVADESESHRAAVSAMWLPLIGGGLITTLTALALMSHQVGSDSRIDDPLDKEGKLDVAARFVPLERPHARGSKASMERGQTFVLPVDTPLEKGKTYPMVMRANPRGHQFGKVSPLEDKNVTVISDFGIAENIDTIVFRDAHEERRHQSAYDLRIPVERSVHQMKDATLVALEPIDPKYDLKRLKLRMMGPYLVLDDFVFQGTVANAYSPDPNIGEHKAMFEHRPEDARLNPVLRTFLSLGYRGPYFAADREAPPLAMVAREGFDAPIGTRLTMRMQAPARGLETGQLIRTSGVLRVPPWKFLEGTRHAVLRHKTDPTQDRVVSVVGEFKDDFLRFKSAQPEIVDFAKADEMKDFTGPYLLPPPYEFEVEVHSAVRAPDPPGTPPIDHNKQKGVNADRRTLVPLNPQPGDRPPSGVLYDPHPAEVAELGMEGPYLVEGPGAQVATLFSDVLGPSRGLAGVLIALLALTSIVGWGTHGARIAAHFAGRTAANVFRLLFLAAAVIGSTVATTTLLDTIDTIMLPVLVINVVAVCLMVPKLKKRA